MYYISYVSYCFDQVISTEPLTKFKKTKQNKTKQTKKHLKRHPPFIWWYGSL